MNVVQNFQKFRVPGMKVLQNLSTNVLCRVVPAKNTPGMVCAYPTEQNIAILHLLHPTRFRDKSDRAVRCGRCEDPPSLSFFLYLIFLSSANIFGEIWNTFSSTKTFRRQKKKTEGRPWDGHVGNAWNASGSISLKHGVDIWTFVCKVSATVFPPIGSAIVLGRDFLLYSA